MISIPYFFQQMKLYRQELQERIKLYSKLAGDLAYTDPRISLNKRRLKRIESILEEADDIRRGSMGHFSGWNKKQAIRRFVGKTHRELMRDPL